MLNILQFPSSEGYNHVTALCHHPNKNYFLCHNHCILKSDMIHFVLHISAFSERKSRAILAGHFIQRFVQEVRTTDKNLTLTLWKNYHLLTFHYSCHLYWVRKEMPNLCVIPSVLPQQGMRTSTYHFIYATVRRDVHVL